MFVHIMDDIDVKTHQEERKNPSPWVGYIGHPAAKVSVGPQSNVGAYLRDTVIYLIDHVRDMSTLWHNRHVNIQDRFAGDHLAMRSAFWNYQPCIVHENETLNVIVHEIKWCLDYISEVHKQYQSFIGHRNFQRRLYYFIYLCSNALCDLRLFAKDDYITDITPASFYVRPSRQDRLGYNSGFGCKRTHLGDHLSTVKLVSQTSIRDCPKGMRLKLPAHFTNCLRQMFGPKEDAYQMQMVRVLLSRYLLLLASLFWRPEIADENFQGDKWYDHEEVFDLQGANVRYLDAGHLYLTLQYNRFHNYYSPNKNDICDRQAVSTAIWAWIDPYQKAVCEADKDCNNVPCSLTDFRVYSHDDYDHDIRNSPETDRGLFARIM